MFCFDLNHEERNIEKGREVRRKGRRKVAIIFEKKERERRRDGRKKRDIGEKEESRGGEQTVVEREIGKKRKKERAGEIEIYM